MAAAGRFVWNGLSRPLGARKVCTVRMFSLTSYHPAKSRRSADKPEDPSQPIKFSTSKASHRTWKVERSMGSQYQRPWWKVLPFCVLAVGFLLWCSFREETNIDRALEKQLYEHLPGLLTDTEEEEEEETQTEKQTKD